MCLRIRLNFNLFLALISILHGNIPGTQENNIGSIWTTPGEGHSRSESEIKWWNSDAPLMEWLKDLKTFQRSDNQDKFHLSRDRSDDGTENKLFKTNKNENNKQIESRFFKLKRHSRRRPPRRPYPYFRDRPKHHHPTPYNTITYTSSPYAENYWSDPYDYKYNSPSHSPSYEYFKPFDTHVEDPVSEYYRNLATLPEFIKDYQSYYLKTPPQTTSSSGDDDDDENQEYGSPSPGFENHEYGSLAPGFENHEYESPSPEGENLEYESPPPQPEGESHDYESPPSKHEYGTSEGEEENHECENDGHNDVDVDDPPLTPPPPPHEDETPTHFEKEENDHHVKLNGQDLEIGNDHEEPKPNPNGKVKYTGCHPEDEEESPEPEMIQKPNDEYNPPVLIIQPPPPPPVRTVHIEPVEDIPSSISLNSGNITKSMGIKDDDDEFEKLYPHIFGEYHAPLIMLAVNKSTLVDNPVRANKTRSESSKTILLQKSTTTTAPTRTTAMPTTITTTTIQPPTPTHLIKAKNVSTNGTKDTSTPTPTPKIPQALDMSASISAEIHLDESQDESFKRKLLDELIHRLKFMESKYTSSVSRSSYGMPKVRRRFLSLDLNEENT